MPTRLTSIQGPVVTKLPIERHGQQVMLDAYSYQGEEPHEEVLVLVHRSPLADETTVPVVRIHSGCVTGDVFHSLRCDCYRQLQMALDAVCAAPFGAVVYLPYQEGRGIGLYQKILAYGCQDRGADTIEANLEIGAPVDARDYDLAARVLKDLGLTSLELLTGNPLKKAALERNGIGVLQCTPLKSAPNRFNARYLVTKRVRMAHDV
ncbi:GTP cyclohydrolase II [Hyphomicrobium sp.]|uniref:GTP cyclohydrolase II n=1 Tax=Hyphomicrobium sp. TaxID=82 RepID=UPI002FE170CF